VRESSEQLWSLQLHGALVCQTAAANMGLWPEVPPGGTCWPPAGTEGSRWDIKQVASSAAFIWEYSTLPRDT